MRVLRMEFAWNLCGNCVQYGVFTRMKRACNAAIPLASTVHPHSLLTPLLIEERKVCEEKVIEKPPYKGVG